MRGGNHPGRSDQDKLSLSTVPFRAMPNAAMPWVGIPMAVKGCVRISRSFAAFCCHMATICSHCYSVTRSLITVCSRLHRVMVCNGIRPSRAAIATPVGGYRAGHLRPAGTMPLMPAGATPAGQGQGSVCQGEGVPGHRSRRGGCKYMYRPPPYLGHPKRFVLKT